MPYIGNIVQDFSVNNAMLNTDSVTSIKIDDGTIVNADINDSAAISMSKLALAITNSEVSASAAIAGSKISPDFGSQAISTTGSATIGGVLQVTAGSNSAPAIHFGDSDSGIYAASGGNNVRIAVGGSDAISASTAGGINFSLAARALTSLTLGTQSATDKPLFFADANSVESSSLLLDNSSNEFRVRNNRFSGKIVFAPSSNVERARIDNGGKLLVGTSTARTNFFNAASTHTPRLQIESTNSNSGRAALGLIYGIANASGPYIVMAKHRSNTVGDNTVVVSGDETGIIAFQGSDGSQFVDAARIQGFVDGTPGADDMPGRLVFSTTADGAASPTERLRIDSSGNVGIGTTNPIFPLETVFTNNNSSSFSTSLAMGSGANADLYALHLQNLGVLTSEVGLLFSAGNTEYGQWSINCLKTGSFVGDLVFRTRTGSATSAERLRIDSSGHLRFAGTSEEITLQTSDGSDNGYLNLSGGGACSQNRGAQLVLCGNERSGLLGTCQLMAGNAGSASSIIQFFTGGSEQARIDVSGRLLIGTSTARVESNGFAAPLQVEGTGTATSSVIIARNSNNASSSNLIFQKSRGTSAGSNTVIQNGDAVGTIIFEGSDGTNTDSLASIIGACDGTPGTNDVPGRLVFSTTADGAASPTERLRITSGGMLEMRSDMSAADQATRNIFRFTDTDTSTTSNQSMGRLQWFSSDASGGGACVKAEIEAVANDTTPEANLLFKTHTSSNTSPTERMRITGDGHVGIGTSSPRKKLDLIGPDGPSGASSGNSDTALLIDNNGGNGAIIEMMADNDAYGRIFFTDTDASNQGQIVYYHSSDELAFSANATEVMRLKAGNDGSNDFKRVLIGTTVETFAMVCLKVHAGNFQPLSINDSSNTSSFTSRIGFRTGNNQVGTIKSSSSATQYNTSSDYRLKENASAISDGITRLKTLKPYRFNWISDETNTPVDGFFAHEVSGAVPEAISGTKDKVADAADVARGDAIKVGDPVYQEIDQSKLVPLLVAALQEEIGKREALESRIAALEAA